MEHTHLIDASTFAQAYTAFWKEHAPTCEHFVRKLNLSGTVRFQPPIASKIETGRRALISEAGFALFTLRKAEDCRVDVKATPDLLKSKAVEDACARLSNYSSQGVNLSPDLSATEWDELESLSDSLHQFFDHRKEPQRFRPLFSGCGFVDDSEADIMVGDTLFEVKSVDRAFRSIDVKQVLTYAALNWSSRQYTLSRVGLVNPRRGVGFECSLADLCSDISGLQEVEFLERIAALLCDGGISR